MTPNELKSVSQLYLENADAWKFNQCAYESFRSLIKKAGVLRYDSDQREPLDIEYREQAAWGADLSGWTVDTMADFVGTVPFVEDFSVISDDWFFQSFMDDCDMIGTDWNVFWDNSRRAAYTTGMYGILVDKGVSSGDIGMDRENGIYPYVAGYSPIAVLDFKYSRSESSKRPYLSYLKLLESDASYKIWTPEMWGHYFIDDGKVETIDEQVNPIGEIPFFWFYNLKSLFDWTLGISEIEGISHIDASIISTTADIAQVMRASGFLMLARPSSAIREDQDLKVGPNEQIAFDADNPSGTRPFWLTPDVAGPTRAALSIIDKQEMTAMRRKNLTAVFATMTKDARSSDSIKQAFRFLESSLNRKVRNELEARKKTIYFWLKWQGIEDVYDKITINHPMSYDINSLITTIQDAMTAKSIVRASESFQKHMDKFIVKKVNPDISFADFKTISDEIDNNDVAPPDVQM